MGVHDWTRVEAGIFHGFHTMWITEINMALNRGLLPAGYYALPEQHAGEAVADVLTLHAGTSEGNGESSGGHGGVLTLAVAAPRTRLRQTVEAGPMAMRRTLAIRHVSGHRLVAMLEIVLPGNKDRGRHVTDFARKGAEALEAGINLLVVDLFPPGPYDPGGMHTAIRQALEDSDGDYGPPAAEPLTLAAYVAGESVEAFVEHLAVGAALPEMPVFLGRERYVPVPLAETYDAAYRGMPAFWRDVIEGRRAADG